MKAMIFAAGLGTRLRPLTDTVPKALIEVGGIPMLRRVIERLTAAGIKDIVVNVHHHAGKVKEFIAAYDSGIANISVSDESDLLLDTGGGVAKAIPLLGYDDDVLLHNVDIFTDFDLGEMIAAHKASGADATLLCDSRETSRYLLFDNNRMTGWENKASGEISSPYPVDLRISPVELAFGGIHIVSPKLLHRLVHFSPDNPKFSITPFYIAECDSLDIRAFTPSRPYHWIDIGKPDTLERARRTASNI